MHRNFVIFASIFAVGTSVPAYAQSDKIDSINGKQIAKEINGMSHKMEIMGKVMNVFAPHIGKAIDVSIPEIEKAAHIAQPAMKTLGNRISQTMPQDSLAFSTDSGELNGRNIADSMQIIAKIMTAFSIAFEESAPEIGAAYDKASPHVKKAIHGTLPEIEKTMTEAAPLLEELGSEK